MEFVGKKKISDSKVWKTQHINKDISCMPCYVAGAEACNLYSVFRATKQRLEVSLASKVMGWEKYESLAETKRFRRIFSFLGK